MRSLHYRLSGRCRTLDDCLHLARRLPPSQVAAGLQVHEHFNELLPVSQLVGRFVWHFPAGPVTVEQPYAAMPLGCSPLRHARALRQAQVRLDRGLDRLRATGISCHLAVQWHGHPAHEFHGHPARGDSGTTATARAEKCDSPDPTDEPSARGATT